MGERRGNLISVGLYVWLLERERERESALKFMFIILSQLFEFCWSKVNICQISGIRECGV